jgi:hypothetical protein
MVSENVEREIAQPESVRQSLRRCECEVADDWRCAVRRGLRTVSCHCACHDNRLLRGEESR